MLEVLQTRISDAPLIAAPGIFESNFRSSRFRKELMESFADENWTSSQALWPCRQYRRRFLFHPLDDSPGALE